MTSRIRLARLAAPLALIALVPAVSGCGATSTLDPVAQAATTTSHTGGARLAMTLSLSLPTGQHLTMPGIGVVNMKTRDSVLDFDLSQFSALTGGKLGGTIEERTIYPNAYLRASSLAKVLPGGKQWIKVDLGKATQKLTGANLTQLTTQNSPADQLQQLRARSGGLQRVGSERVRGVQTTHYRGTVDVHKLPNLLPASQRAAARKSLSRLIGLTGSSKYPIDVWVDAHHLVRREHLAYTIKLPGSGQRLALAMTMDFFDFGPKPPVTAPPANQVFDATGFVGSATTR